LRVWIDTDIGSDIDDALRQHLLSVWTAAKRRAGH